MQSASGRWTMDRQIYSIRRTKCGKICGKKTWKKMWKEEMEKRRENMGKKWGKTWIGIFLRKKRGLATGGMKEWHDAERTKKVLIKNVFISCFHGK